METTSAPALELSGVTRIWRAGILGGAEEVTALTDCSLSVAPGEIVNAGTKNALVGAKLPFEIRRNLILGDNRREPVGVLRAPNDERIGFKHGAHAIDGQRTAGIRGHRIEGHALGQQLRTGERVTLVERFLRLLGALTLCGRYAGGLRRSGKHQAGGHDDRDTKVTSIQHDSTLLGRRDPPGAACSAR